MIYSKDERLEAFSRLLDVLDNLRTHCPWDRKQTNESLRANTIEEVYELSDALQQGDTNAVCKELGDVLLHVLFYARIGDEQGDFDIVDVCNKLCNKLIFRHPHIYATEQVEDAGQVVQLWEQVKQKEKDGNKSVLSGVPSALPALIKAYRIQDKARAVGFDWQEREEVWAKVREELQESEKTFSPAALAVSWSSRTWWHSRPWSFLSARASSWIDTPTRSVLSSASTRATGARRDDLSFSSSKVRSLMITDLS